MLDSDVHYLNHGAFGATPYPVFAEYQRWQKHLESNPTQFFLEELESELDHARTRLGTFLGTMPENLALLTNCTLAMNIIARSIPLHPGDEVLLTAHEYGAIERIW